VTELREKLRKWEEGIDGLAQANDEIKVLKYQNETIESDLSKYKTSHVFLNLFFTVARNKSMI